MRGILKKDKNDGWVVQYIHQLGPNATQIKRLQLCPDDVVEYQLYTFFNDSEVTFYIVENKKMSGIVQYAKLVKETHLDGLVNKHPDDVNDIVTDKEIEKQAKITSGQFIDWSIYETSAFIMGAKWAREQLKQL
jgi:hypothetical protein